MTRGDGTTGAAATDPHPPAAAPNKRRGIRYGDRVLIPAVSGGGKSTIAAYLVACAQPARTILVDPKEDWDLGVPVIRDPHKLPAALRGPVAHYIPADAEDRDELTAAYNHIWAVPGPLVHWEDEGAETTTTGWAARGLRSTARLGRAPRKLLIVCTQRIAECHPIVRTQASHVIIPTQLIPPDLDLKMLATHLGLNLEQLKRELDDCQQAAGEWGHIWHVVEGRETRWCSAAPVVDWPRKLRR